MVWVLGGHADTQRIQDTLGVVEAESGWRKFLSHCFSLRRERRENRKGIKTKKKRCNLKKENKLHHKNHTIMV